MFATFCESIFGVFELVIVFGLVLVLAFDFFSLVCFCLEVTFFPCFPFISFLFFPLLFFETEEQISYPTEARGPGVTPPLPPPLPFTEHPVPLHDYSWERKPKANILWELRGCRKGRGEGETALAHGEKNRTPKPGTGADLYC